jgi:hypothetical protein
MLATSNQIELERVGMNWTTHDVQDRRESGCLCSSVLRRITVWLEDGESRP